jgi:hypothetical protein
MLGRMYKTTAAHLDPMRDTFTLDCSAIKSYVPRAFRS